jgi:hypothetical protein
MHLRLRSLCPALLLVAVVPPGAADEPAPTLTWTFETDHPGKPPGGFSFARTGEGKPGSWIVRAEPGAPSGRAVLTQVDRDETDYRFPLAITGGPEVKDFRVSVKCRAADGKIDQAYGLVFRYKDENNYYVTRANALENNVRLYHVKDGRRVQFAGWNGKIAKNTWHQLAVEARGDLMVVSFDGNRVIEARDTTFANAGRVGLWTKADSLILFDDLTVTPLR